MGGSLSKSTWPHNPHTPNRHVYIYFLVPGLLDSEVGVDTGVPGSAREIFVFAVGDMGAVLRKVLFGQSEVDYVQLVTAFAPAHQEIVRLNVSVQEVPRVHVLHPAFTQNT